VIDVLMDPAIPEVAHDEPSDIERNDTGGRPH
jgi:hypothetical protein